MQEFDLESNEPKIIKTQDENGEIHNFELLDVVKIEEQEYGLLIHLDEHEGCEECSCAECGEEEDEGDEIIIMKLSKQDDAYTFETIEDDEEFNKVVERLEEEGALEIEEENEEEE